MRTLSFLLSLAAATFLAAQPAADTQDQSEGVPTVSVGHTGLIRDLFTSPDGKLALTFDGVDLRAWDVATGKEIKKMGRYSTWYSGSTAHFVPERGWLVFCSRRIDIYDLKTLRLVKELGYVDTTLFNQDAPNGLWANADTDHIDFGEIVESGFPNAVLVIKSEKVQSEPPFCRRLISIGHRRVLADTNYGIFIINLEEWSISSPGRTAQAGKRTSVHLQEHVNEYTFTCDPVPGWSAAGPNNTILRFPTPPDDPAHTVSILDGSTLKELRSAKLATPGRFLGSSLFNESKPSLWFASDAGFTPVDFETLAPGSVLVPQFDFPIPYARVAPISGRNEAMVAFGSFLHRLEGKTGKSLEQYGGRIATVTTLKAHPTRLEFVVAAGDKAKRVRFTPGGLQIDMIAEGSRQFAYRPEDGLLMAAGALQDAAAAGLASWPGKEGDVAHMPTQLVYSPDGSLIAGQNFAGITVYRVASRERILNVEWRAKGHGLPMGSRTLAISPDNVWLITSNGDKTMVGFDLENRELAWEQPVDYARTLTYFPGKKVFTALTSKGLETRAVDTGLLKVVTPIVAGTAIPDAAAVSPDGRYLVYCDREFTVFDSEEEKPVFEAPMGGQTWSVAFLSNPRYVISTGTDKLVRLWDIQEKKELCVIGLFGGSNDWIVTTPQLRFDGTEKGLQEMYVVRDANVLPLESLFETLHTPKLIPSLLAGEKLDVPIIDLKKLSSPPIVRLELMDAQRNLQVEDDAADHQTENESIRLRAVADAHTTKLQELRLYQNGKLIATRPASASTLNEPLDLKLVPGENTFKAIAVNSERTESLPHSLTVAYKPSVSKSVAIGGLRLHLLVVGVNQYKNPKYNLNYAVADATAVKKTIEQQTQSIFSGVNATFISDTEASKSTITSAFRAMSSNANARDVFVFYYAGHGVMTTEAKPEFYLVPHDVTQLYGADDDLRAKGISAAEIQELAKSMPAQKQLFILDACQSAGALTSMAMRGAAEEKAIAQLARSTGTHWLTASGSEQFATEFEQLGHGAFTYVLLQGLAGKADTGDGRVTVNELKAYLESQVPEVTQKHKGTPQFPSSYGFGQDFPVAVAGK
jgi:WD40 repeat protein